MVKGLLEVLADTAAAPGSFVYLRALDGDTVLVFMNTSSKQVLLSQIDTGLPSGAVLENWHTEPLSRTFDPPKVGTDGRLTLGLSGRAVIVAHATGAVAAEDTPQATIAVSTLIEGQTFTQDTVTISPATAALKLVLDGSLGDARAVTVGSDGAWSITLPVSQFPVGLHDPGRVQLELRTVLQWLLGGQHHVHLEWRRRHALRGPHDRPQHRGKRGDEDGHLRIRPNTFGLSSWNGVRVYATTWDHDGVLKVFRPITAAGGAYVSARARRTTGASWTRSRRARSPARRRRGWNAGRRL